MTIPHLPEGMTALSPHLVCDGAADAIPFYEKAFGATELLRLPGENGRLVHAAISLNGGSVLEDPFGHVWSIATPQRAPMSATELADAAATAAST